MSLTSFINKISFPSPKEIIEVPSKIKETIDIKNINTIKVRYFDTGFKNVIECVGTVVHKTSIPIVYFEKPDKLGVILLEDCIYNDKDGKVIDVCQDYLFAIKKDVELIFDLKKEYYNDVKYNLVENTGIFKENSYSIPVLLNQIPREIIRIDMKKKMFSPDDNRKIEITQYIIRQLATVNMLERLKKDSKSPLIVCAIMFIPIGILIGIIISFFWLK